MNLIKKPKTKKQLLIRLGIAVAIILFVISQYDTLLLAVSTEPVNFTFK